MQALTFPFFYQLQDILRRLNLLSNKETEASRVELNNFLDLFEGLGGAIAQIAGSVGQQSEASRQQSKLHRNLPYTVVTVTFRKIERK